MERRSWGATDKGLKRGNNEDSFFRDDDLGLYVVADGVGGQSAGEHASLAATRVLAQSAPRLRRLADQYDQQPDDENARRAVFDALEDAVERANQEVYAQSNADIRKKGMMTTLTAALISRSAAFVAHVGDSRCYLWRKGELDQVTVDHTLAEMMVRAGRIKREEMDEFAFSHVLARAIGEKPAVDVDLLYVDLMPGDRLLLCSDGLHGYADMAATAEALANSEAEDPGAKLIQLANQGGGGDNIAAVVVRVKVAVDEVTTRVTRIVPLGHQAKADLLGQLFFCRHLSVEERLKVLRYVHEVTATRGQTVVRQGEDGQDLYLVIDGELAVYVDRMKVTVLKPGEHFGEIALVRGQKRTATVVAKGEVRLFRLSREGFYDLGRKDQAVAVKMLWAFAQSLAGRVTQLSQDLVEIKRTR